jgi:hypothetical protein
MKQERRREPRSMCAHLVQVRIEDAGSVLEATANLEDISPSGACIQLEAAAREGSDVEIVCAECRLRGKVRYCRFVEIGYDVGIAFDRPGSWEPERFMPRHFLEFPSRKGKGLERLLRDLRPGP